MWSVWDCVSPNVNMNRFIETGLLIGAGCMPTGHGILANAHVICICFHMCFVGLKTSSCRISLYLLGLLLCHCPQIKRSCHLSGSKVKEQGTNKAQRPQEELMEICKYYLTITVPQHTHTTVWGDLVFSMLIFHASAWDLKAFSSIFTGIRLAVNI